jgi:hypothetical protein
MSKFNRNLLDEMNDLFNEWYDDVVPDGSDDQEIGDAINALLKERDDEFARARGQLGLDGDDLLRHHIQWYKDKIKKHKQGISTKGVDLDDMIMDLEDKIRNPRRPPRKNPWNRDAMDKKRQEAVDRLGGESDFEEAAEKAGQEYLKVMNEFESVADDRWWGLWSNQVGKALEKYSSGKIDEIEHTQMDIRWLKDAIRKIKAEQDQILDDMIMDLESKVDDHPWGSGSTRKNPRDYDYDAMDKKRQEAVDRLGGRSEFIKAWNEAVRGHGRAWDEFKKIADEKWKELSREQFQKFEDKFCNGEIDTIEHEQINTQWLKDAIRQIKKQQIQDVDLDDMIMDLESKVEDHPWGSGSTRKNPWNRDAIAKKQQEAVDRLGGWDGYLKDVGGAHQEFDKAFDEFWKIADEKWKELWYDQRSKAIDKYDNGEIDAIEQWQIDTKWLKDAIRQIKKQQIQDVDLDDMIMDLESKVEDHPWGSGSTRKNPKPYRAAKPPRKNPRDEAAIEKKRQEAIDRLGGEDKFQKAMGEAYKEWDKYYQEFIEIKDDAWYELWEKQDDKTADKFDSGEIDIIEADQINIRWLKDAIRQIKKQQIQDVDLDDMIMDLESKVEDHPWGSGSTRKNPKPKRRKNPSDYDAIAKRQQEAIDRLGGRDEYGKTRDEAYQEFLKMEEEFCKIADEKWWELWIEQGDKSRNKYLNGEIDAIESWKIKTKWLRDAIRQIKAEQDSILDDMIMDLEDRIRNPSKPMRHRNPVDEAAMAKKKRETIDRLGGRDNYDEAFGKAYQGYNKAFDEFDSRADEKWQELWCEQIKKTTDRYFNGEIDSIELWQINTQWLKDAIRKIKADQDQILDDMIMDLEDKIRNPRRPMRKNPWDQDAINKKKQETIDRLGGRDEYEKTREEAYHEFNKALNEFNRLADKRWEELWREQDSKYGDKYFNGEIDEIEYYQMNTQFIKGAIRKIKAERQVASVDLDDMIMDLEDKIRNPRGPMRKNPWDYDAMEKKRQEALDRLGGEDEYKKARDKACQEYEKANDEFYSVADERWRELWAEHVGKTIDKNNNGEIDDIEELQTNTQWLKNAIRKIKAEQDLILDDMIMDLESKVDDYR